MNITKKCDLVFMSHCPLFYIYKTFQANCIDSTIDPEKVYEQEVNKLRAEQFKPFEMLNLEEYERGHACVLGGYRIAKKPKIMA